MSCCPVNMEPARATAPASGAIKTFGKTNLFVTGPAKAKAGVLSLPDIFGIDSGRTQQDAEALGQLGYAVVVVDAADGDYKTPDNKDDVLAWLNQYSFDNFAGARIADAIAYLQQEAGVESISSYGYCWGCYLGAAQSASANPVIKGHVSFHPGWLVENMLHGPGSVEKLAERITVPQLLLSAGNDPDFVREGGSVEKILKAKVDIGELSDVVDFPDVIHGWVNRGDLQDPTTKAAVMKAWHAAVKFTQTVNPL
ncbi:putative endo-1,3-1,4-beta glucanase [Phytophthora cinnamomi]|uniref:putative endo-1,3-1,4-beta glucanase n=1 Tax=Phytophthora cinnamomi TaxID=4785 RepID=UPI00355A45A3|nr:putative endo-1,3-1,4-beta glucanase [Phytophthora cinnamomi]